MYPFTRKYQAGGALDTNAMRDDLSKDGDFFRDGNYTQKGRRRLAAIQKVEDNQDNGLSYNIDDKSGSFEVVDALGRLDVNSGGHGIGSSERSGLLYGTFNKDKRSKREISSLMSGASKYIINNVEEEADTELDIVDKVDDTITADTTIADTTIGADPSPKPIEGLTKEQEEAKALGLDFTKGATAKILSAQKRLKAAGFDPGPLDGKWGVNTQAAWNKAYPKETSGKTAEEIEAAAKLVIEGKKAAAEAAAAEAAAKAKAAQDVANNEVPAKETVVEETPIEEILNPNVASNNTISAENLDKITDSPIDNLDRIAEAGDIQEEINLRKSNGGVPSEDPRFKGRSVAELEMDKYDLVERGQISTTTNPGGDLFDVNLKTNTSTQGGTLFSGIGEGDVKGFLKTDDIANQLFSSKYNKGIIDNSEKIKLYRDEIKSRRDSDYNKASSPFAAETVDQLNEKIKGLNKDSLDSINNQVISSYDNTRHYIEKKLAEQSKILTDLQDTNASAEDIKNAKITEYALRSRIAHLKKRKDVFHDSNRTKKDYKDFYGDVVLSDDKSVMWDKTRNKVSDSKTRSAEIKEVKKGKSLIANVLKEDNWLKPEDRKKFRDLVANDKLNKGDDGKGFDAQKMIDRVTEEYIKDVGFFEEAGTYKDDVEEFGGNVIKSFTNFSKDLGVKDIYKDLRHLKTAYTRYVKSRGSATPREAYNFLTIPKIKSGEDPEKFLKKNRDVGIFKNTALQLGVGGTTDVDMVDGGYKAVTDFFKNNNINARDFKEQPHKALWLYSKTYSNYDKDEWDKLSKRWDKLHFNSMAKYKKGGVLKFQGGNKMPGFLNTSLDGRAYDGTGTYEGIQGARAAGANYKADMAERARIKAIEDANNKAAYMKFNPGATDNDYNNLVGNVQTPGYVDPYNTVKDANIAANTRLVNGGKNTGYKPKFSFLPQLNLGDDSNSAKSTTPNFYTTRKTPEQLKQEEIELHINNTQKLSPLSDNVERKELDPITNIVNKIFNKGADANQNLGPSERQAQKITMQQKRQPVITKNPEGIEKESIQQLTNTDTKGGNFFTTYKTPEQIKQEEISTYVNSLETKKEGAVVPEVRKTLGEKILSRVKKAKDSYLDAGDVNSEDGTEGNAPLFSRTGINTPLGEVQYNDIAQYYLAKRARDRKVGDVKLNLKKHIDQGYNNVLSARDIDRAMLNQADQEIAKISSGYKGSDPLMAMVANKMAGEAKNKAKMGVISERADFRGKEEKRVFDAMNVVRKQKSDDNVRANDTRFANNQLKFNAELASVKEKAAREAKFDNVKGKLFSNIQGRANTNAALEKGLITEAEVIDRQNRATLNESRYKDANIAYSNAIDKPEDQQDADEIAKLLKLKNSADDARNVDKYDRNKATANYNRINKGTSKLQLGTSIFKNLFG